MRRKAETFFDAITLLREDLVEEAQNYVFRKKRSGWRTFGCLAACLVLAVSLGLLAAAPGGGGGADNNSSSAPIAVSPGADAYGAPSSGGTGEPDAGEPVRFTAIVTEIQEEAILVEPTAFDSHVRCLVSTAGLDVPELSEGDWVSITCAALIQDSDPPVVLGVYSIEKADGSQ